MTINIESFAARVPSPSPRAVKLQWIDLSLRTAHTAFRLSPCGMSSELEAVAQAPDLSAVDGRLPIEKVFEMEEDTSAWHDLGLRFR